MERFRSLVHDAFLADVGALRRVLTRRLRDDQDPFAGARFAWEAWHVPGQFSQLRAPARAILGTACEALEARVLRVVGRELGAARLGGPLWISILRDGDFQSLHRDSPNGDFAMSFGLGLESRFRGGETLIARDELLDYFGRGAHTDAQASAPLFDEIASRQNRLVVFDARLPHAVRHVEGPREARFGRIAVQGWLRAETVVLAGDTTPVVGALTQSLRSLGRSLGAVDGLVVVGLTAPRRAGRAAAELRAHTLAPTAATSSPKASEIAARVARALASARLPHGASATAVVRVVPGKGARLVAPTRPNDAI